MIITVFCSNPGVLYKGNKRNKTSTVETTWDGVASGHPAWWRRSFCTHLFIIQDTMCLPFRRHCIFIPTVWSTLKFISDILYSSMIHINWVFNMSINCKFFSNIFQYIIKASISNYIRNKLRHSFIFRTFVVCLKIHL